MTDPRPCKGDAYHMAEWAPGLPMDFSCHNCSEHADRGGKCLGIDGAFVAAAAGVKLEGEE